MIPLAESLVPPPTEWHANVIRRAKEALEAARAQDVDGSHEVEIFLRQRDYDQWRAEGNQRIIAGIEIARTHLRPGESLLVAEDARGLSILGLPDELPDGRRWTHGATGRCREGGVALPAGSGRWLLDDGRFYMEAR